MRSSEECIRVLSLRPVVTVWESKISAFGGVHSLARRPDSALDLAAQCRGHPPSVALKHLECGFPMFL